MTYAKGDTKTEYYLLPEEDAARYFFCNATYNGVARSTEWSET